MPQLHPTCVACRRVLPDSPSELWCILSWWRWKRAVRYRRRSQTDLLRHPPTTPSAHLWPRTDVLCRPRAQKTLRTTTHLRRPLDRSPSEKHDHPGRNDDPSSSQEQKDRMQEFQTPPERLPSPSRSAGVPAKRNHLPAQQNFPYHAERVRPTHRTSQRPLPRPSEEDCLRTPCQTPDWSWPREHLRRRSNQQQQSPAPLQGLSQHRDPKVPDHKSSRLRTGRSYSPSRKDAPPSPCWRAGRQIILSSLQEHLQPSVTQQMCHSTTPTP